MACAQATEIQPQDDRLRSAQFWTHLLQVAGFRRERLRGALQNTSEPRFPGTFPDHSGCAV